MYRQPDITWNQLKSHIQFVNPGFRPMRVDKIQDKEAEEDGGTFIPESLAKG